MERVSVVFGRGIVSIATLSTIETAFLHSCRALPASINTALVNVVRVAKTEQLGRPQTTRHNVAAKPIDCGHRHFLRRWASRFNFLIQSTRIFEGPPVCPRIKPSDQSASLTSAHFASIHGFSATRRCLFKFNQIQSNTTICQTRRRS